MNYIISGKNIEVTDALKQAIYEKLERIEKFFGEDTAAQVTLSVDKDRQKIEVTIPMKGHTIRAEQASDNMYVSIDLVVEIIERQVTRHKKRILDKEQNSGYINNDFFDVEGLEDEDVQIIRMYCLYACRLHLPCLSLRYGIRRNYVQADPSGYMHPLDT